MLRKYIHKVLLNTLWIFIFVLSRCSLHRKLNSEFEITVSYPLYYGETKTLRNLTDTIPVIKFRRWTIYFLPYTFLSKENGNLIEIPKFNYFVFKNGQKYGFLLRDVEDTSFVRRLIVDSIVDKYEYLKSKKFTTEGMQMISRNKDENLLIETYIPVRPLTDESYDTIKLYFNSKLNDIDFSLSKSLDSSRKMKLAKVRIIFNEKYLEEYHQTIPQKEMIFEIRIPDKSRKNEIFPILKLLKQHFPDDS